MSGNSAIRAYAAANSLVILDPSIDNIHSPVGRKLTEAYDLGITHYEMARDIKNRYILLLAKKNKPDQAKVYINGSVCASVSGFTVYACRWTGSEFVGV